NISRGNLDESFQIPVSGDFKLMAETINRTIDNLNVFAGEKVTVELKGELLQLKQNLNQMVDSLNLFAGEVTRVALDVGTEGKLGGQANVPGVSGTWKDLTDNVNNMAANLTSQ
nr:hypothetical protein [Tanacetum cinerariifolium]